MRGTLRLASAAALVSVVGAVAVGCGGGDDGSDGLGVGGRLDQRRDRRQPADEGHRGADAEAVHRRDRHQGQLHGARRGHPAPGDHARRRGRRPAVRRGDDRHVRSAPVRQQRQPRRPHAAGPGRQRVPVRRPDRVGAQRPVGRRQALRVAVLRGVVVPDVPQGRPEEGRRHHARQPDLAGGRGHRRARSTRPTWPASACAASRAGRSRRLLHDGAEHVRRHLVVRERRTARSTRRWSTSPSSRRRWTST